MCPEAEGVGRPTLAVVDDGFKSALVRVDTLTHAHSPAYSHK